MALGRDGSNPIRIHDNEVSRRHAEIRPVENTNTFRVVDLGSANGTFVNDRPIDQAPLRAGDQLRLGRTVLLYGDGPSAGERNLTQRVNLLGRASPEDRSAIIRSLPAADASRAPEAPIAAGEWLKVRLANLAVLYQATQAISHILDVNALLPRILELVFDSINADRGIIMLAEERDELKPKAVRWREPIDPEERMTISMSIVEHVRESGQGVITSDAPADARFAAAESIVDYGIREAICVPIQGRHSTLGVLYADTRMTSPLAQLGPGKDSGRFTQEHLMLMIAIGHQAGLAIENTSLYQAKLQAERLAAVGQTIATLSHHIKNILQGIKGGSYLIDLGLNQKDEAIVRRGWSVVEKNQAKIYELVMDMLSFSKDREPALEPSDLNQTILDVIELMQARAKELGVALEWSPADHQPPISFDVNGIHRAVLNIVTNALNASEDQTDARVSVSSEWDEERSVARVIVADNGIGIAQEDIESIFEVFASSKGTRGTGLGLPVSRKIVREHGGNLTVSSEVGQGARFVIELPLSRRDDGHSTGDDMETLA